MQFCEKKMAQERKDPFDGEYVGNIWGWKFSWFGLALILLFTAIMLYRHWKMGVPFGMDNGASETTELTETPQQ